jgi:hypothetical protein
MQVSDILKLLPESLDWMVLFNLSSVGRITTSETIRGMYHLPETMPLEPYSHVVLTSHGRFLATDSGLQLVEADTGEIWDVDRTPNSLGDRYRDRLNLVTVNEADCLGLAEEAPFSPVLLHLRLEGDCGKAQAIFDREPSFEHYELLQAVGVKFLRGEAKENYYLAHFQNRLPIHIHAGILSHFSRTAHCNVFFFRHGNIHAPLETGLQQAAQVRAQWSQKRCLEGLIPLAEKACETPLSMTCQPPAPEQPFPYGDLVPLGFVLRALNHAVQSGEATPELIAAQEKLEAHVIAQQEEDLWAFHRQRLITATDSSLVLLGLNAPNSVEALERFADGKGGYYHQLWSNTKEPGKMLFHDDCSHWCQPDYGTTCIIRSLRHTAGLSEKTSIEYLEAGFEQRSGLYFANPYLVDWVLAEAIRDDAQATSLRDRLRIEVLNSLNADYSFGQYDLAFSTALGILTLGALGVCDRTIRVVQLRLMELISYPVQKSAAIPFYSTLKMDEAVPQETQNALRIAEFFNRSETKQKQIRTIAGEVHNISLYLDTHRMITTAVFALALSQPCDPTVWELKPSIHPDDCHARYRCQTHSDYIAKFALLPYLNQVELIAV